MLLALALATATQGSAPRLVNPELVTTMGNLEGNTLPSNHEGVVHVALTIDPLGQPFRCDVVKSSGFRATDQRTCAALTARARFTPARDAADVPITSVVPLAVRWAVGTRASPGYLVDMAVQVKAMPAGIKQPVTLVRQIIAADGGVESCEVDGASGVPGLDALACKQAEALGKLGPARNRANMPVRTMRLLHILFVEADD